MLAPCNAMCKTQRRWAAAAAMVFALACTPRQRRSLDGFVGDRGGAWPGGIGAVLRVRAGDGRLFIHRAPDEGAAARAGLRAGDEITAIEGEPVAGIDRGVLVQRLRGEVGTTVRLTVRSDDGGATRDVSVERAPYRRGGGD